MRQADEIPGAAPGFFAVEPELELAFDDSNELILVGMNMRRNERSGRKQRVEGERRLGELHRPIGLAENIPDDVVEALATAGNSEFRCHMSLPSEVEVSVTNVVGGAQFGAGSGPDRSSLFENDAAIG